MVYDESIFPVIFLWDPTVKNYRVGIMVQSGFICIFCILCAIHEVCALASIVFIHFLEKNIGRTIVHALVAFYTLGFCGGYGMYNSSMELMIALICFMSFIIEAWNGSNINSEIGAE